MAPAATPSLGFIIITHGRLGEELLRVARYIVGERLDAFRAVEVPFLGEMRPVPGGDQPFADRREQIRAALAAAVAEVDQGGGTVILTDIIGGTSSNVAQEVLSGKNGAIVSGVNLPMLLKAVSLTGQSATVAAAELVRRTRNAIQWLPGV